jgi:RNA polymerase sigma-70 factor (ECF subfamily)
MSSSVNEMLRAFYVEYRQQLYTYAVSITHHRETAEDAIQQAFQQLLCRDRLSADLRPYVFRCVRNAALDGLRRAKVRAADSIFEDLAEANTPSARAPAALSVAELNRWLQMLSPDERETIVLKIYDAFSFQEIADLRGVPLSTTASWYRRGLAKLRAISAREER